MKRPLRRPPRVFACKSPRHDGHDVDPTIPLEGLTVAQRRAIRYIVDGLYAYSFVKDLVARGVSRATLHRLIAKGLVASWDRPDGLAVTLTPRAAEAMSLVLGEFWVHATIDDPEGDSYVRGGTLVPYRAHVAYEEADWRFPDAPELTASPHYGFSYHRLTITQRLQYWAGELPPDPIDDAPGPVEEAIAREEAALETPPEPYVMIDVPGGEGQTSRAPAILWPGRTRDGGRIPVDPRIRGKNRRRAERLVSG